MIQLSDLLAATGGAVDASEPDITFTSYCFDSRRANAGELFVALKTERGDGHDFVAEALARGCTGALVNVAWQGDVHGTCIVRVPDTFKALTDYAAYIVRLRKLPIVAVTGSVGKTGAREAIAAVLAQRFNVFRNPANFNGRLGLPIALGALEPQHQIMVLEMASDAPGEIRELCAIAPPQVGIVTRVSETHLAYFGSLDAIAQEKGVLIESLLPDGLAILNQDDHRVWQMRTRTQASVVGVSAPEPLQLSAQIARTVGQHFGISAADIEAALQSLPALNGRMNLLRGVNGAQLIDDTFSASPASVRAAIAATNTRRNGQLFLVLGDMDQLGDDSARLHREIGAQIAALADTTLITYGELARHIADAALDAGMSAAHIITTYITRDAIDYVKQHVHAGDTVLIKGDTSARMERIVAALLVDPSDARLLARQEPGWESVRVARPVRPTWLDVDLDAIAHNVRLIKGLIGANVQLMAVLKADGYGHGAIKVARTALNNGATFCGVASLNEATALRAANIDEPILILGYTPGWHARDALMRDVRVTIYDMDTAHAFSKAAQELNRTARVHIKIDSGMGRLGVLPADAAAFIRAVGELPGVQIEGLFTHFACADSDPIYTREQLARFTCILNELGTAQFPISNLKSPLLLHAANSAATLVLPETHLNMVRVGLAMYGLSPFAPAPPPTGSLVDQLRPALAWKTTVAQVKTLPAGHPVSYGATWRCPTERCIAVIPVGYADGFRRAPHNPGEVLVRGQRAPIVGRVCMDQTMLDVTDIPGVRVGDEVALIGRQGSQSITAEDVAARIGTINYEVVSAILPRVPRVS